MPARRKLRLILWIIAVLTALWLPTVYAGLILIFLLLCTTPNDAIRLPRWISELVIFACSAGLARHSANVWIHLGIVIVMLMILRLWQKSPWWAVMYGWFPIPM